MNQNQTNTKGIKPNQNQRDQSQSNQNQRNQSKTKGIKPNQNQRNQSQPHQNQRKRNDPKGTKPKEPNQRYQTKRIKPKTKPKPWESGSFLEKKRPSCCVLLQGEELGCIGYFRPMHPPTHPHPLLHLELLAQCSTEIDSVGLGTTSCGDYYQTGGSKQNHVGHVSNPNDIIRHSNVKQLSLCAALSIDTGIKLSKSSYLNYVCMSVGSSRRMGVTLGLLNER